MGLGLRPSVGRAFSCAELPCAGGGPCTNLVRVRVEGKG